MTPEQIQNQLALVDSSQMTHRAIATGVLGATALMVILVSGAWAYSTVDFWEGGPIIGSIGFAAAASVGALYVATRRVLLALLGGLVVGAGHFVLLLVITLSRWEG